MLAVWDTSENYTEHPCINTPPSPRARALASIMHGVRHAVACGAHGEQYTGSLKFVVSELQQTHTHAFNVARCCNLISASMAKRTEGTL